VVDAAALVVVEVDTVTAGATAIAHAGRDPVHESITDDRDRGLDHGRDPAIAKIAETTNDAMIGVTIAVAIVKRPPLSVTAMIVLSMIAAAPIGPRRKSDPMEATGVTLTARSERRRPVSWHVVRLR